MCFLHHMAAISGVSKGSEIDYKEINTVLFMRSLRLGFEEEKIV